jgi:dethiobiotin synthetase
MNNKVVKKEYFITGIGTDVGKTIVAAVLTEALEADYWKPVQAGNVESSDPMIISNLISNKVTEIHRPYYSFEIPASPHFAAEKEGRSIEIKYIKKPVTKNHLVVEGAGGLLVPLNKKELVIDLIVYLQMPVILVVKNYLGAINHTLLSVEALVKRSIPIAGIIFNGGNRNENIPMIESYTGLKTLGHIPDLEMLNKQSISKEAVKFNALK